MAVRVTYASAGLGLQISLGKGSLAQLALRRDCWASLQRVRCSGWPAAVPRVARGVWGGCVRRGPARFGVWGLSRAQVTAREAQIGHWPGSRPPDPVKRLRSTSGAGGWDCAPVEPTEGRVHPDGRVWDPVVPG